MQYTDLRDFIFQLSELGKLKRINLTIDPHLEITEICNRTLQQQGPALLFEKVKNSSIPVLGNLFGTIERVALGMGATEISALREIGNLLAFLKQPDPPQGIKDAWQKLPILKKVMNMTPRQVKSGVCQEQIIEADEVDLYKLPVQTCWPEDAAPLITWGLTVTKGVKRKRQNLGIYRQQVLSRNKVIMRWLAHRGGALDFRDWQEQKPSEPFPVAVVLGADPATLLAAVCPIPDTLSEYAFAGLLRGSKTDLVSCLSHHLQVPATAEIILEGHIYPGEMAEEGPFGDHTGYYNEVEKFPVFTVEKITQRDKPIYLSTYTGRPPDEPAILGLALNEVFVPLLKQQFPEICDFYLPAEACSYRMAIVSIHKQFLGHAKQIMLGVWSFLRQFMYTKFVIVVDDDINVRSWNDVIWALSTRMDPARDTLIIENTPIDYLDFASPTFGLGSKMGLDATNKWPGETTREWGRSLSMSKEVIQRIDQLWNDLNIF